MQETTKQRIAGSIAIVALAVILLPMIFDGGGGYRPVVTAPVPAVPILPQPVPIRPPIVADAEGLPEAWTVRVGTFAQRDNVNALLAGLRAADYRAYTRDIDGDTPLTGVYVGPWPDRALAEEYLQQLQQQFQPDAVLLRFETEGL